MFIAKYHSRFFAADDGGGDGPAPDAGPPDAAEDREVTAAEFTSPDGDGDPHAEADEDEDDDEDDPEDNEDDQDDDDQDDEGDDEDGDDEPVLKTIKVGDKEYEVPEELEEQFMLKADHTRKTQEIAETRKELEIREQYNEKVVQLREGQFQDAAGLFAMDQRLAQYQNLDWDRLATEDPVEAQRLRFQFDALKDQRSVANQQLQQKIGQAVELQHQHDVEQSAKTRSRLASEIDGFSEDTEEAMAKYAMTKGANEAQLRATVDYPILSILHDAYLWDEHRKEQTRIKAKGKPKKSKKPATPAAKVKGRRQKGRRNPDNMSTEAWVAERNAEVARKEGIA